MYPIISVIETSALQKLRQCYGSNKTQKCPGKSDVEIKILFGNQPDDGTETNYDDTQYINSYRPVGGTRAATYSIQAQEAAYEQADVK